MCIICLAINNDNMSSYEAKLALAELSHTLDPQHIEDLIILINTLAQEDEPDDQQ